ncbi:hypothetical protein MARINON1_60388 [Marinobacter salarius]|uniref:hypothetical protein n=1 Tax=Marinobacter salarius TaxID=1420917 RepID=UPI0012551779|nr:hypothetical protein [Marinobacter salarius]MDP4533286.1 hypothetical protein [Marinobacter salarius]VVS96554.1 hypothetical protein MBHK15_100106 [Marinobacter salarius]VXC49851.1 hypothetical protein MARINON1_60388 [Marinobacter salarius]
MQKESAIWLVIRTIGLLLLLVSVFFALEFMVNVISIMMYEPPEAQSGVIRLPNLRWDPFYTSAFSFALSGYFLSYGKAVFRWLNNEGQGRENF